MLKLNLTEKSVTIYFIELILNILLKQKIILLILIFLHTLLLFADPVSQITVEQVCKGWMKLHRKNFNKKINSIRVFKDKENNDIFYAVNLDTDGFILLSSDDMINPIIAFSNKGVFHGNIDSPLYILIEGDMKDRISKVKKLQNELKQKNIEMSNSSSEFINKQRWSKFENIANQEILDMGLTSVDDLRVAPLTSTLWSQNDVNGDACYNYYTPSGIDGSGAVLWNEGSADNYPTGCVATATAQLLRFFQYPTSSLDSSKKYTITCNDVKADGYLKGSDGAGAPYAWANMPENPTSSTLEEKKAIGALMYDCGLSVEMAYYSGGSSAGTSDVAKALTDSFGYKNAISALDTSVGDNEMLKHITEIINPNLDAGLPVIIGLKRPPNFGHAVICDGYGYSSGTIYHHLNLGWGGLATAWYNLPSVDAETDKVYNKINVAVFNVFTNSTGEIISGRVLNASGEPVAGATVSAGNLTDVSDDKGIYALIGVPSNSSVTLSCQGCNDLQVDTALSKSGFGTHYSVGNVWDVNLIMSDQEKKYTLTVNKGSGSGKYTENTVVDIAADFFLGLEFVAWEGDIEYVGNANDLSTTVTMPAKDITLTPTYKDEGTTSFSIGGTISGDIQAGVTLTLDSGESTQTDADGNYLIDNLPASTYILTPSLAGYSFSPSDKSLVISTFDLTGIDFVATKNNTTTYSLNVINGTGSGQYAQGTIVSISANIPPGQEFDIWTGDSQYIDDLLKPVTTFTMPAANLNIEATFKATPVETYSISGTISGDVYAGVNVYIDADHSAITDSSGKYTITGLPNNNTYTITPSLNGYSFDPPSQTFTIQDYNIIEVDFVATKSNAITYSLNVINGTGSGQYAQGAIVSISANIPPGQEFDIWTGDSQYIDDLLKPVTTFTMPAANLNIEATFKTTPVETYSISGTISGDVYAGVSVYIDAEHSAITDSSGKYTITGLPNNNTYTITPSLNGYSFDPPSQTFTIQDYNIIEVDFVSSLTSTPSSPYQKVTYGSIIKVKPSQITGIPLGGVFEKVPKLYANVDGKKLSLKKVKSSTISEFIGIWKKKYSLNGKIKRDFASVINKKNQSKLVEIMVKGKIDGKKEEYYAQKVLLVAPEVTHWKASGGNYIDIYGLYFGEKPPKVSLEPQLGGKLIKGKVDKKNYLFNPETGESFFRVYFNMKKFSDNKGETFWIIIDNKIGIGYFNIEGTPSLPWVKIL